MGSSESKIVGYCCRTVLDDVKTNSLQVVQIIQDEPAIGATVGPSVVPTVEPTVEPTAGPTIFDYLLEDCWRAVLDYVPLRDIIRSERVSRQWQAVVLGYLSHSRIGILAPGCQDPGTHRNVQMLELQDIDWPSFERWTKKLGPSVVLICLQPTKNKILIVRKNCPNLETITFISFTNEVIPVAYQNERLTKLRRICFGGICKMSDSIIGPFLANDTIEELELGSHSRLVQMTGQWLIDIKLTNLKSLILKNPYSSLIFRNFLTAAASGLLNLTRLELMDVGKTLYKEINSALEKLPALETLCFMVYKGTLKINGSDDYGFFKAVSRLSRLKHLKTNVAAADEGVLAVTRSCEELQVLMLEHCPGVTERGLASAWRSAGGRLTALGLLKCAHMTEDMLVATVTSCPNLKLLDVDVVLTEGLLARTAAARRDGGAHRRVLCMRTSAGPLRNNTETERDDDGSANAMPIDNEPRWNREDLKNYPELKLTFGVHFSCYYDWTSGDSYYWMPHYIETFTIAMDRILMEDMGCREFVIFADIDQDMAFPNFYERNRHIRH